MEWDSPQIISSRVTAEDSIIAKVTVHTYIWTWYILRTFAPYIPIVRSLFLGFSRTLAFYLTIIITFLGFSRLPRVHTYSTIAPDGQYDCIPVT